VLTREVPSFSSRITYLGAREKFEASYANIEKLRQLTGWSPSISIEDGIRMMIAYKRMRSSE
jgi:nucleoside-diphosphate-sugar epimerase